MEKGMVRDLILQMNKIEKEIKRRDWKYPEGSDFFTSSIPPEINKKEDIVKYFRNEIQKLHVVSDKLMFWFDDFLETDYKSYKIPLYTDEKLSENFQILTIPELHLYYLPLNPETMKPYDIRQIRNWVSNNSSFREIKNINGRRYSRLDFERLLVDGNIEYNKEITKEIFEFLNRNKKDDSKLTKSEIKEKIISIRENWENNH